MSTRLGANWATGTARWMMFAPPVSMAVCILATRLVSSRVAVKVTLFCLAQSAVNASMTVSSSGRKLQLPPRYATLAPLSTTGAAGAFVAAAAGAVVAAGAAVGEAPQAATMALNTAAPPTAAAPLKNSRRFSSTDFSVITVFSYLLCLHGGIIPVDWTGSQESGCPGLIP